MKKLIILLFVAAMCLSLAACGKQPSANNDSPQEQLAQNDNNKPENTKPEVTTGPSESLEDIRKAELKEILCDGEWIDIIGSGIYPSTMCFLEDGTMQYTDSTGELHRENPWNYLQYVINGEIEGQPGSTPAIYQTRIEYSTEQGVYYFKCEGLSVMLVGYSVDGEYILHYNGYPYKKVIENN